jgi:outer membrane protein OmpA-like peptidoglycan-associated protein
MRFQTGRWSVAALFMFLFVAIETAAYSQEQVKNSGQGAFAAGQNAVLTGIVAKRNPDGIILQDAAGKLHEIGLTANTEVKEHKSNPFRRARNYGVTEVVKGLRLEVKGHGNSTGGLVADELRFTQDDLRLAGTLDARVTPLEADLKSAENRLSQSEENSLRISGQVSELSAVSNAARGGAKAAQETADAAMDTAKSANQEARAAKSGVRATNDRISALDEYDTGKQVTIPFKVGSAQLTPEAKESLDQFAQSVGGEKGYIVEIAGFASADGNETKNRALSQKRADAVIHYLADNHSIPLRRFVTPYGYGANMPVADNKTRDGRIQNRRVEVKLLISKGIGQNMQLTAEARP